MPSGRRIITRRSLSDPLRCFTADWDARPGDVILDPNGERTTIIATEEQLLAPAPPAEGLAQPAPAADAPAPDAAQALDIIAPFPFLNTTIATPAGPARLVRVRARDQVAVLVLPSGAMIEQPLAALREDQAASGAAEAPPC